MSTESLDPNAMEVARALLRSGTTLNKGALRAAAGSMNNALAATIIRAVKAETKNDSPAVAPTKDVAPVDDPRLRAITALAERELRGARADERSRADALVRDAQAETATALQDNTQLRKRIGELGVEITQLRKALKTARARERTAERRLIESEALMVETRRLAQQVAAGPVN